MIVDHSESSDEEDEKETAASATNVSDMDYLRSKMVTKSEDKPLDSSDDDETDSDDDDDESDDSDDENDSSDKRTSKEKTTLKTQEKKQPQSSWTLKMRGLPFKLKEQKIKEFFSPIECVNIRFVNNKKGQRSGRAFVDFKNEEDLEKALKRDKDYLQGRYIELFRDDGGNTSSRHDARQEEDEKPWMKKLKENRNDGDDEDEGIGEV